MPSVLSIPWNELPLGELTKVEGLYAVRTGVVISEPNSKEIYSDKFLTLRAMFANSLSSPLGYTLEAHVPFHHRAENLTSVTFFSEKKTHENLQYKYKDNKVHLLQFNSDDNPSYWFLVRFRP